MPVTINGSGSTGSINTAVLPSSGTFATQSYADTAGGLVKIVTQSFSAVSSVSVDNCFTSTYENYRVIVNITAASATDSAINFYYRASGVDTTTSYRRSGFLNNYTTLATMSTSDAAVLNTSTTNATQSSLVLDSCAPQLARITTGFFHASWTTNAGAGPQVQGGLFLQQSATQFDGFSLAASTGTISGVVRVYGYRN